MGRVYRPVEISSNGKRKITVAIVDTGADETVVSEKVAKEVGAELYGTFRARCASQTVITAKYADFNIKEMESGRETSISAGVSDIPFDTDDIDDEGLGVILGVDFIQKTGLIIKV